MPGVKLEMSILESVLVLPFWTSVVVANCKL